MKKRICFVMKFHPYYKMGGAEIQAWLLAKEISKTGWDVHYVSGDSRNVKRLELVEGINVHRIKWLDLDTDYEIICYKNLRKTIREIDADIYYQRIALPLTGMVARISKLGGKKFIWASSSTKDCTKNKFREKRISHIHRNILCFFNNIIYNYGIRKADIILAQSNEQADLLKNNFIKKSLVLKNGWPLPETPINTKTKPKVVIWVSNFKPLKRPELFVKLAEECCDIDAKFLMVGRCESRGMLRIVDQIKGMENIDFHGFAPTEEVNSLLEKASILVNTSDYEGFPNSFIQAWMRKVPVVSLNVDPDNVIREKRLGLLSGNFDQLVKDVRELISYNSLREELGENSIRYASNEYDITQCINDFVNIIEDRLN